VSGPGSRLRDGRGGRRVHGSAIRCDGRRPLPHHPADMLALPLGVALLLQVTAQPPARPAAVVRDSAAAGDTVRGAPRRLPVTAEVLASAFRDPRARELYYR